MKKKEVTKKEVTKKEVVGPVVRYKKLPEDKVMITELSNFLSFDEILDKHGRVVASLYSGYSDNMVGVGSNAVKLSGEKIQMGMMSTILMKGSVFSHIEFQRIIVSLKKCGDLLHKLVVAVKSGEIKEVRL